MEAGIALTAFAQWLNQLFFNTDYAILSWYHDLAQTTAGRILSPILNAITLTAWKGAFLIVLAIVLICFRKTRRAGLCSLLALAIGVVVVNGFVKDLVARPRPYDFDATMREWWVFAGSHFESDYCFPSGHMNAACAFTSGFVFTRGKKWLPWGLLYVVLMGISRNFLIVHYPSDIVGGFIFGTCAGLISWLIIKAVYKKWGQSKLLREE